ncbi:BspA family leucine-rich repeat surface protein [Aequorivita sp. H23M31]|uniref:BspA family leucine-rich repeat surface protein n=1 Tax=Aequorivita ciconiae TaxID=2494375 RepID=A0A410G061_9FLAO|nr:BspA family leucine-rich repeat surface protein [Aequorivita sp. H23M31]QAA80657.1 BspA family leucine-rich repeat surface protein [Aequorivita sp. H23M31]
MKRITVIICIVGLLSLSMNAQVMQSSSQGSRVNRSDVESSNKPTASVQEQRLKDHSQNQPIVFQKPTIKSQETTKTGSWNFLPSSTGVLSGSHPEFYPKSDQTINYKEALELSNSSAERSNLACSQENPTNGFEVGYTTSKNTVQIIATDITVPADTDFTLNTITINIHSIPGVTLISADITLYENASDLPGTIKSSQAAVIPVSQTIIGNNNGYDISEIVFDINPVMLQGQAGLPTTYWVSLYVDMTSSDFGYIDSTSASVVGLPLSYSEDAGATWLPYPGWDTVYIFDGDCGPLGGGTVNCSEENPNDFTFEDGYNCSSDYIFKTANDLTVAADDNFTLEHITASIMANNPILTVNVNYYDDASGLPGTLIGSENSVSIDSQTIIGSGSGYDVHELQMTVTPFTFPGQSGAPTTYWIELSISDGSGGFVFWVATTSSMIGHPLALYDGGWTIPDLSKDGVYIWEGTCDVGSVCQAPTSLSVDAVTQTTADISWVAGGSETEWIIQYGAPGFDPNSEGTTVLASGSSNTVINGLTAGTNYDVYVKADCGSNQSIFTGPVSFLTSSINPGEYFVTTWQTTMSNEMITIPTTGSGYNYSVDWGDGNTDGGWFGDASHIYTAPGVYTVKINGAFPRIYFNNSGDRMKIKSIEQWGVNPWTSMNSAFLGCENLVSHAMDMPDLSMVTDMYGMFAFARKFNGDANFGNWNVGNVTSMYGMFGGASIFNYPIGNWNVGNVTTMEKMFDGASLFNQPIDNWNVGNVTSMNSMFRTAMNFNQDLNSWNVSNVTDMSGMFAYARKFNGAIGNWNVGNVTNMKGMFGGASVFNQYIGGWDVGNVTDMEQMFHGATIFNQDLGAWNVSNVTNMNNMLATAMKFNQDISNWNVSNVTNMRSMFFHANRFDQNLGAWDVSNVTDMTNMFVNVTLSTSNYDALLNGWSALPLKSNVKFHAGLSKYCAGEPGRNILTGTFNWTIIDGGMDCGVFSERLDVGSHGALVGTTLYPNPMRDQLNILNSSNSELESLSIYDLTGRLIQSYNLNGATIETVIDVSHLSSATYMVIINGNNGSTAEFIIKE